MTSAPATTSTAGSPRSGLRARPVQPSLGLGRSTTRSLCTTTRCCRRILRPRSCCSGTRRASMSPVSACPTYQRASSMTCWRHIPVSTSSENSAHASRIRWHASQVAPLPHWPQRACSIGSHRHRSTASLAQWEGTGMSNYAVVTPATGETVARYDTFSDAQVEQALARAQAAFEAWRKRPVADRAAIVRRAAELHRERRKELAAIITREMGKPFGAAVGEVDFSADITQYYADQADAITGDQPLTILGEGTAVIRRSPLGVLFGIMPWNFPYYQVARFAAPNLVLGNVIVLKHASQCPESAAAIEAIYRDAGLPDGAYVNVYVSAEQAAWIVADPRIQGVSVTGSERAGAAVAEVAGRHLKKVALELGGSDPFLVLATDNLDAVVEAATEARLDNTGQSCNAAKRFIVVDGLYDEFVTKFAAAMTA